MAAPQLPREAAEARLAQERVEKIREYEQFVNDRLKVDLKLTLEQRDRLYAELAKYLELRNTITMLMESKTTSMKTLLPLGCHFYAHASVPDTSRIMVKVGLGFHVEFTLAEALEFIDQKEKHLTKQAEELSSRAAKIKTKIRLIYEGINQLVLLQ